MQTEGLSPNNVTFICILKACRSLRAVNKGKLIHDHIWNSGMLKKNTVLDNALVDMHAKCSLLTKARQVLEELPVLDSVLVCTNNRIWYAHGGQGHETLTCFAEMLRESHFPTNVTFICGSIGEPSITQSLWFIYRWGITLHWEIRGDPRVQEHA